MNWGAMMRAAGRLGLGPESFWRLSLKEWRWLTGVGEVAAMGRDELERLAERWPDEAAADGEACRARSTAARSPSPESGGESR